MLSTHRETDKDDILGREFLVIALHSSTFFTSITPHEDGQWKLPRTLVYHNSYSIRIFAITRRIPYADHYSGSPLEYEFGILTLEKPLALGPERTPHSCEVYLKMNGRMDFCRYDRREQKNVTECIYNLEHFTGGRPCFWPEN